ncbi:MAG: peptidoglycan editing factor PgeF [Candidatus Acidiferrales bacterium]
MATIVTKKRAALGKGGAKRRPSVSSCPWTFRQSDGLQILEAPALARLQWLAHGFSTRPGGGSELATLLEGRSKREKILNLSFTDWDSRTRVLENRKKFFRALDSDRMRVVTLRQIHSDIVHPIRNGTYVSQQAGRETAPRADAAITCERGVLLVVQTADCIPILLADSRNRAVAAIHSGWRGTLRRIAEKTLGRMRMEFGTRPEDVIAALGPGIGRCCYGVGPEVAKEFHAQFAQARDWFEGPFDSLAAGDNDPNWLPWLTMMPPGHQLPAPTVHLDLLAANRAILAGAGLAPEKIFSSGFCTACRTDLFFSYRREHATGRLMAAIGIC